MSDEEEYTESLLGLSKPKKPRNTRRRRIAIWKNMLYDLLDFPTFSYLVRETYRAHAKEIIKNITTTNHLYRALTNSKR